MLENDLSPNVADPTVYLKDYRPPSFLAENVTLDFELAEETIIRCETHYRRVDQQAEQLWLDGEKLDLEKVVLDGQELSCEDYELHEHGMSVPIAKDEFTLQITTRLRPQDNTELSGLYQSSGNFCTQCEAQGFRRITYFQDRPDVLSEYEVTLTAKQTSCPVLLSNGNPVARGEHSDGRHWFRWHDPLPKPCYLFALVAGDLQHIKDSFETMSGRPVELNIYTQSHNIDKCTHAMTSLKNAMRWDEQVYGREYDLEVYNIVAVDDFNMGAMENKGLNIFNSKYVLADQQSATDIDFQGIESVIAHEYFHNWSGNRITCRDWFQLSLKEGFTVFRDQEFSADMGSRAVQRVADVQRLRTFQFKEDAGPMAHPVRPDSYQEINNFYTVTIYEKGAEVIRMMHRLLGADGFRAGTDLYFQRFDGKAVTTEDFVRCMESANDTNLEQFRRWYTQAGTPVVQLQQHYDAGRGVLTLNALQSCPPTPGQTEKQPFVIPLTVALFAADGTRIDERTLVLNEVSQNFDFDDLAAPPVVSVLRDFSAPIKLEFAQSNDELAHLLRYDDNGFSRWQAMQQLSLNLLLPAIADQQADLDEIAYVSLLTGLQELLRKPPEDPAMLAQMLSLPAAGYLADQVKPIDPQRVQDVLEQVQQRLANDLFDELLAMYGIPAHQQEFSLAAPAMAERALKNTCLRLLLKTNSDVCFQLAYTQYYGANNMTDRLAAFAGLLHSQYENKQELIAHFYSQWRHDTLVLDKWFAMQATIPEVQVLSSVHRLLEHSAFSISNPNKVRSLVGAFTANMRAFHRSDGAGYQLLGDIVLQLNQINPQVGARLAGTFNNWRAYAAPYADAMQQQLLRIQASGDLSRDISEIVAKALAEPTG